MFKNVNDQYGHLKGDEVLINLTRLCHEHIRSTDIFARFGGEEFVVLLVNCSRKDLFTIADRIRIVTSELRLSEKKDNLSITISIGGYYFDKNNILTGKEIIDKADQAMYESKETGRNKCTIHSLGLYNRALSLDL